MPKRAAPAEVISRPLAAPACDVTARRPQKEGWRAHVGGGWAHGEFCGAGSVWPDAGSEGRQPVPGHVYCEQVRGLVLEQRAQLRDAAGSGEPFPPRRRGCAPLGRPRGAQPRACSPCPTPRVRPQRAPRRLSRTRRGRPGQRRTLEDSAGGEGSRGHWPHPP